jgi:hypothetical protein
MMDPVRETDDERGDEDGETDDRRSVTPFARTRSGSHSSIITDLRKGILTDIIS